MMELPLTTTSLFHLMRICQQAYHIPCLLYTSKYKRKRFSGRLLIAAAVICTGMGVTVAAKEFFKWNDHLLKRLEPSEKQQETMQESTYIQNINQSVTQNGVTVTLTDSIQDQGFLYAFFEVETDDNIPMTDHTSFEEMTHFKIDGKEVYLSLIHISEKKIPQCRQN